MREDIIYSTKVVENSLKSYIPKDLEDSSFEDTKSNPEDSGTE